MKQKTSLPPKTLGACMVSVPGTASRPAVLTTDFPTNPKLKPAKVGSVKMKN